MAIANLNQARVRNLFDAEAALQHADKRRETIDLDQIIARSGRSEIARERRILCRLFFIRVLTLAETGHPLEALPRRAILHGLRAQESLIVLKVERLDDAAQKPRARQNLNLRV